ncbi:hypothetical protein ACIP5U_39890 [Streptomyces sp. NPDC088788]|uniref:hypothetical protein n=1 Tax=Streptomyces sp. NPDC088788 TaxID=3365898 RepID=UPI003818A555
MLIRVFEHLCVRGSAFLAKPVLVLVSRLSRCVFQGRSGCTLRPFSRASNGGVSSRECATKRTDQTNHRGDDPGPPLIHG